MTHSGYHTYLPDLEYYQKTVACQFACPVRTDARGYVTAIAQGDYERAYLIARESNPFASTCGWVCGAPCEAACRRGQIDAPVAIRALKRFVNDRYGVFLDENTTVPDSEGWKSYSDSQADVDLGNSVIPASRSWLNAAYHRGEKTGKRIAVVGAGPAGLTCAHDLALRGHEVVIFEASSVAGGMLQLGVPEYRLPRELVELEIQAILALGPTLRLNQALGRDFTIADLRREFDAVFLGIGTYRSRNLNVEGEQLDGVLRAVDFLININLGGYNLDLGDRVLVVGGGNVAMDVARTAARLGSPTQAGGDIETTLDVARTAIRLGTTHEVHCLVIEDRHEMLAEDFEIEEAEREGIVIHNHVAPSRILGTEGHAIAVETLDVARAFDEQGRFNPELVPETAKRWDCDSVIIAIGQTGDLDWVRPEDGLEVTPRGTLAVDRATLATTVPGIYAGGDIAFGPRLIINAVADGQRAAASIHAYLQKLHPRRVRKGFFTTISRQEYPEVGPMRNYLRQPHQLPSMLPVERRVGVSKVEATYDEATAHQQASRCLVCTINPVFDGDLCILCNGCVDVCPTNCLKLVPVSQVEGDDTVTALIERRSEQDPITSAMLFDPTQCIRCGLCAARCPTNAVEMQTFRFTEEIVFESEVQGSMQ